MEYSLRVDGCYCAVRLINFLWRPMNMNVCRKPNFILISVASLFKNFYLVGQRTDLILGYNHTLNHLITDKQKLTVWICF